MTEIANGIQIYGKCHTQSTSLTDTTKKNQKPRGTIFDKCCKSNS